MAQQAVAAHAVDLEPIDRLEEKITRLVTMVAELRASQARAVEECTRALDDRARAQDAAERAHQDNVRLSQEVEGLRARMSEADATSTELLALRDERDLIRTRVSEMLQQLDAL
jgi:regulator of replication initiation timing